MVSDVVAILCRRRIHSGCTLDQVRLRFGLAWYQPLDHGPWARRVSVPVPGSVRKLAQGHSGAGKDKGVGGGSQALKGLFWTSYYLLRWKARIYCGRRDLRFLSGLELTILRGLMLL